MCGVMAVRFEDVAESVSCTNAFQESLAEELANLQRRLMVRYEQCVRESEDRCWSTVANLRMELAAARHEHGQRDGDIRH